MKTKYILFPLIIMTSPLNSYFHTAINDTPFDISISAQRWGPSLTCARKGQFDTIKVKKGQVGTINTGACGVKAVTITFDTLVEKGNAITWILPVTPNYKQSLGGTLTFAGDAEDGSDIKLKKDDKTVSKVSPK